MVEPRPAKTPIWNTGGSNRTEPGAGKKVTGWAIDDEPPSSYFNWLQYYAGAAIEWLYERMNDGTNEEDLTISALQPDSSGDGGDLILQAGPANTAGSGGDATVEAGDAVGTDQDGGDTTIESGASTGLAGAIIALKVAEREGGGSGSGTYTNTPTTYVELNGKSGNKNVGVNRYLAIDNAADTARGQMRIVAKARPTAGPTGDAYLDSTTYQMRMDDNVGYRAFNSPFGTPFFSSFVATDAASEVAFSDGSGAILYSIPTNYLSTGSRIKMLIGFSRLGTPVDEPGFNIRMGAVGSHAAVTGVVMGGVAPVAGGATLDTFYVRVEICITAAGTPGTAEAMTSFIGTPSSTTWQSASHYSDNLSGLSVNTGFTNELFPTVTWNAVGAGGQWAIIRYFSIEIE